MQIQELLSILPIYEAYHIDNTKEINQLQMDSRLVKEGDVFVCIEGFTVDGHDFAKDALEKGAALIVSQRQLDLGDAPLVVVPDTTTALALLANQYYDFPSNKLRLVGITGTNGKTTTTYLLERIFREAKRKTAVLGTIQLKIGEETRAVRNTTPDALSLQQYFAEMVEKGVDIAFMEVSSHALELGRVYGTDFDLALFTNLSQDHLDYHKTMEAYLHAKSKLFSNLGSAYGEKGKVAILNADDPNHTYIKEQTMQPIVTYGIEKEADFRAVNIDTHLTGTNFTVQTPKGTLRIQSHLNGIFNVYNMLAAISVAYVEGISLATIQRALEKMSGVDGRFERVDIGQPYAVIVDYAHTPDSLENVLKTIQEFAENKVYVVVGSGGDRDRGKRPLMAEAALRYSDYAIFTSDNPRTEDPLVILKDMTSGLSSGESYEVIENRKDAIYRAIALTNPGDVVLIAGKGHETYQEINGVRYDFDDRLVAKEAIEKKGI